MQFNSQSSSVSPQVGLGLGVQAPGLNTVTSAAIQQQPGSIHQQSNQQALLSTGPKDAGNLKLVMPVCSNFGGIVLVLGQCDYYSHKAHFEGWKLKLHFTPPFHKNLSFWLQFFHAIVIFLISPEQMSLSTLFASGVETVDLNLLWKLA